MELSSAVWIIGGTLCGAAALFILALGAFVSVRDRAILRQQPTTLHAWAVKRGWRYLPREDHRLSIIDLHQVVSPPDADDTSIAALCSRPDGAVAEHVISGHRHGHSLAMFQRRVSLNSGEGSAAPFQRTVRSSYTAVKTPGPTPILVIVYQAAELVNYDDWQLRTVTTSDAWFDRNFTVLAQSREFAWEVLSPPMRTWLREADLATDTCIVVAEGWCFIPSVELLRPTRAERDLDTVDTFVRRIPYHVWHLEDGV